MNWKEKCKKGVAAETGVLLRNLLAGTPQKNKKTSITTATHQDEMKIQILWSIQQECYPIKYHSDVSTH